MDISIMSSLNNLKKYKSAKHNREILDLTTVEISHNN